MSSEAKTMQNMQATDFGKVAVLMGGHSAEREISLKSGNAVLKALKNKGVDAHPVDPDINIIQKLLTENFTRAFICLHGRGGEDGVIQGALETSKIPYTGSGVLGSALGMDKYRCKLLWKSIGLPTPEFVAIHAEQDLEQAAALGFPLMIKPAHEGSSIGMARVEDAMQLEASWKEAANYDNIVLAERWITGNEYTCAILGEQLLPMIRLETPRVFYDYEAKYHSNSTSYHCPCGLPNNIEAQLQALALQAFQSVGATGWGRVDLFTDQDGNPWLLEVNTVPGMTDHSLVPMAAKTFGIDFEELVWRILHTSLQP